ncbi:hypothetical protein [Paraflavitalea speifideaquila]|uniref:hypothetical protein n=1 Tax=Paraflavitalea speifideaquila TaxID=3076558 RepID=UPI0028EB2399|nr:hypothetical protein [Paraflavitalea speifideiaquila]
MKYRQLLFPVTAIAVLMITSLAQALSQNRSKPVIIGYVGGYNGTVVQTDQVDAARLSHINYAFVDVRDNRAWLHNEKQIPSISGTWWP